ncbi:hypothetical protein TTHERM_001222467 (macronuclear) [Tetrahymena thermophila SB210]|uniref:Uncharacterized protein n=1 Tax=Tetrahymena thermophila (strain SB210) TaxID=312017 RepID=W7XE50_TETTS|nr:hypothetical protein TTHERM_001222467 [Tetrahymena thermophila SB210]EWS71139.1 hypothetical protein TTHERM_001222467 [Tetrahymena thermophila SB210]|eukprot:XP_012656324.1 hypothetical protein TTHERM_001222467 [Tetrahymena thermophila SB210]
MKQQSSQQINNYFAKKQKIQQNKEQKEIKCLFQQMIRVSNIKREDILQINVQYYRCPKKICSSTFTLYPKKEQDQIKIKQHKSNNKASWSIQVGQMTMIIIIQFKFLVQMIMSYIKDISNANPVENKILNKYDNKSNYKNT